MRNAGLVEAQAGIKIARRNINNLKYADDPTLMAEGFPSGLDGKVSVCNVGDPGSIPGLGRCPGEGHGNRLQCSCLENSCHGQWNPVQSMKTHRVRHS